MNCAFRLCPDADALYAADHKWWTHYKTEWQHFQGMRFSNSSRCHDDFGTRYVPSGGRDRLSDDKVSLGNNSGHQAIGLAYLMGASQIVLLGFDMQGSGRQNHFHDEHRGGGLSNPNKRNYRDWGQYIMTLYQDLMAAGVNLVNASRETSLEIPRVRLEDLQ